MMIKKEKLAIKDDFAKKKDFHKYLRKLNKKFTLNKTKHVLARKKLTDLTKKFAQIYLSKYQTYEISLSRVHFPGDDGYQKIFSFFPNAYFTNIA